MTRAVEILVAPAQNLYGRALAVWNEAASSALEEKGEFTAALSGGKTPEGLYRRLAEGTRRDRWAKIRLFQVDERHVPRSDPASNFAMIERILIEAVPIPPDRVHPVPILATPSASAREYDRVLRRVPPSGASGMPRLDLIFLGIGADGHTASLFPGSPALSVADRAAVEVVPAPAGPDRVTLTLPVLNNAGLVVFLATGPDKAEAVGRLFRGAAPPDPAALVSPNRTRVVYLLDTAAAAAIPGKAPDAPHA